MTVSTEAPWSTAQSTDCDPHAKRVDVPMMDGYDIVWVTTYRAHCDCGWEDPLPYETRLTAHAIAQEHAFGREAR